MENVHLTRGPIRTLAIDPGTREMGYAVLEANEPLYFGVHTFKERTSARSLLLEGQRFVTDLINTYDPRLFVIEKTFYAKSKRSSLLHVFVEEMKRFAIKRKLLVLAYAPTTVKKAITGDGAATKREVAETLIRQYPYLAKYLRTDIRTEERYWENMFDAVAVGLTGYERAMKQMVCKALEERARGADGISG